ncbi:MSMEG_6728 family protein [Streptomyces sp. TP-A0874]|uniref:MSMEG_6728 family protein n=1 Tax=Streptomyces sp. TP-A0874 TaxID=549819 RepID=UPI000853E27F|nr:MSMEG_6728 family protein [Streptomyces sp. TP-A0874]
MQTFLPLPGFLRSAQLLDTRRLGKQRVEALQVLRALTVPGYGWRSHPAVLMWAGYEEALVRYGVEVCRVWSAAGHRDSCQEQLLAGLAGLRYVTGVVPPDSADGPGQPRSQRELGLAGELPPWLGEPAFHRSHQSALVRKAPDRYGEVFPEVPPNLPYVWPLSDRPPTSADGRAAAPDADAAAGEPAEPGDGTPPWV